MHFLTLLLASLMALTVFAVPAANPWGGEKTQGKGSLQKVGQKINHANNAWATQAWPTQSAAYNPWIRPQPTQSATQSVQHQAWKRAMPTPEAQVLEA